MCAIDSAQCTSGEDGTKLRCLRPAAGYAVDSDGFSHYVYKSAPAPQPVTPTAEPTAAALEHNGEFLKYLHNFFHWGGAKEFDIGNQTYLTAVIGLGALVAAIGVFLVLVWFVFLCCR